jgi:hypothetical protein
MSNTKTLTYENPTNINEYYFAILKRLVKQKGLDANLIPLDRKETNLRFLQKVVENLFASIKPDRALFECSLKEYLNSPDQLDDVSASSRALQVQQFAQIILYKTLPCPRGQACKGKPREIAPYNQYSDEELSCVFYHHHKDRRRIPITPRVRDEFLYKANYDRKKDVPNNAKYSRNYFESIYHPIYYKLFKCKRVGCNQSYFCPFNHSETEKLLWDEIFQLFFLKRREMYTGKNYSSPLKEISKTPYDTDLYLQMTEQEPSCQMGSFGEDSKIKDISTWDKISFNSDDDDFEDSDTFSQDNCPTLDSLSYLQQSPLQYSQRPSLAYTQSPMLSYAKHPSITSLSQVYSPGQSLVFTHESDHSTMASPNLTSRTSPSMPSSRKSSNHCYIEADEPLAKFTNEKETRQENNFCSPLGHYFDWEKVKNIMNIQLTSSYV